MTVSQLGSLLLKIFGMTIAETFFTNATDTREFPAVLSRIEELIETRWRGEKFYVTGCDHHNACHLF